MWSADYAVSLAAWRVSDEADAPTGGFRTRFATIHITMATWERELSGDITKCVVSHNHSFGRNLAKNISVRNDNR